MTNAEFFGDLGEGVRALGSWGTAAAGYELPDGDDTCPSDVDDAVKKGMCPAGAWTDHLTAKKYEFTAMVCS